MATRNQVQVLVLASGVLIVMYLVHLGVHAPGSLLPQLLNRNTGIVTTKENTYTGSHVADVSTGKFHGNAVGANWSSDSKRKLALVENCLPQEVINGVKKFVFFIGYARSGHSIVGTIMDAHPHVVISHQYVLFRYFFKGPQHASKEYLFKKLCKRSTNDKDTFRATDKKGYTLKIEGLWQGTYDNYIEVIGDKSGAGTTDVYLKDKQIFKQHYRDLRKIVGIPIRVIHVLRNPFDIISTDRIIDEGGQGLLKELKGNSRKKVSISPERIKERANYLFGQFEGTVEMTEFFARENVLELHNSDLVSDPRGTISRIFSFLEVDTTEHYLDVCSEKIFKSVSRSRDMLVWPPEEVEMVEQRMRKFEMLNRYNFTSD